MHARPPCRRIRSAYSFNLSTSMNQGLVRALLESIIVQESDTLDFESRVLVSFHSAGPLLHSRRLISAGIPQVRPARLRPGWNRLRE